MHSVMMSRALFLGLGFVFMLRSTLAAEGHSECFDQHIRDAIQLNQQRSPRYSQLTNGESDEISRLLIGHEKDALLLARFYLWRTEKWRKSGIPVFCSEFAPMSLVAEFREEPDSKPPRLEDFIRPSWSDLERSASVILDEMDHTLVSPVPEATGLLWADLSRLTHESLAAVSREPRFNCMYRHVLESVVRVSKLAPIHARQSRERGLPSPESWAIAFVRRHLSVLKMVDDLDKKAAPIQARGIPILCQDVPPL
jgi:hypothetical protein